MSEPAKKIIQYFCDRFLKVDEYPSNLKDILDLQLDKLRNIKGDEIKKITELKIRTFRDLAGLTNEDIKKLKKKVQIDITTLNNALIATNLIVNAWNKRKLYLKKPKMKVVFAGLNFAGKTSLVNRLINDYNFQDMINLEPTIGANLEEFQSDRVDLILWDLGGQSDNIQEYLESPERFFVQLDVLIFVIDSQDDKRYIEAGKYLNDIIDILSFLNENPYIVILLNKADTDISEDPDFQIKLEYLTDKISKLFKNSKKQWSFDIFPTSLYNFYSIQPDIAKSIKNIFSMPIKKEDKEIINPNLEEKLKKILDVNLNLINKVVSEVSEIKRVLFKLSPSDISHSLFSVPFEKVPTDYLSMTQREKKEKDKKKKRKSEYEHIKKKKKGTIGPPKRLEIIVPPKAESNKITDNKLKKAKELLKNPSQLSLNDSIAPSTPPRAPIDNVKNIKSLVPPPPPKLLPKGGNHPANIRMEVMKELKLQPLP